MVPTLLTEAFAEEFLGSSDATRRRRALLSLLLTTAELGSLTKPAASISLQQGRSRKIAEEGTSGSVELTSEQAAQLLHVSRTHLNTLVYEGKLGDVRRTEGGHRRISRAAVLEYEAKTKTKLVQRAGLDRMTEASRRIGLYDTELDGLPVRRKGH
jgi:excisionase family DNA binding protein